MGIDEYNLHQNNTRIFVQHFIQSENEGLKQYVEFQEQSKAALIIGGSTSDESIKLSYFSGIWRTMMISSLASSPVLSDKATFPYFARTFGSESITFPAFIGLIQYAGWTRMAMISDDSNFAETYHDIAVNKLQEMNIEIPVTTVFPSFLTSPLDDAIIQMDEMLDSIKASNLRIIWTISQSRDFVLLLSRALLKDMVGKTSTGDDFYLWMIVIKSCASWLFGSPPQPWCDSACLEGVKRAVLEGVICYNSDPSFNPEFIKKWDDKFGEGNLSLDLQELSGLSHWGGSNRNPWVAGTMDAIVIGLEAMDQLCGIDRKCWEDIGNRGDEIAEKLSTVTINGGTLNLTLDSHLDPILPVWLILPRLIDSSLGLSSANIAEIDFFHMKDRNISLEVPLWPNQINLPSDRKVNNAPSPSLRLLTVVTGIVILVTTLITLSLLCANQAFKTKWKRRQSRYISIVVLLSALPCLSICYVIHRVDEPFHPHFLFYLMSPMAFLPFFTLYFWIGWRALGVFMAQAKYRRVILTNFRFCVVFGLLAGLISMLVAIFSTPWWEIEVVFVPIEDSIWLIKTSPYVANALSKSSFGRISVATVVMTGALVWDFITLRLVANMVDRYRGAILAMVIIKRCKRWYVLSQVLVMIRICVTTSLVIGRGIASTAAENRTSTTLSRVEFYLYQRYFVYIIQLVAIWIFITVPEMIILTKDGRRKSTNSVSCTASVSLVSLKRDMLRLSALRRMSKTRLGSTLQKLRDAMSLYTIYSCYWHREGRKIDKIDM
eukprot:TRINITY_DN1012_c0_g1_i6.p1 TRINITY_DN1012_c0_g1~~TRINITY_DN1012_c0_g1_i6.p1  ORF type:complete len:856 (-),score=60.02 TRINITY_DN1012_c0_g1_i6:102-2423(-)